MEKPEGSEVWKVKKLLAAAFAVFLAIRGIALADQEPEAFTFRGIEWGADWRQTADSLSDLRMEWLSDRLISTAAHRIRDILVGGSDGRFSHSRMVFRSGYMRSAKKAPKIGSYAVDSVILYFACVLNDENALDGSADNTALFGVQCTVEPANHKTGFSKLKTHFTSLYGEPDHEEETSVSYRSYQMAYWYGADDTMLVLQLDDWAYAVRIWYIWNGGEKMMEEIETVLGGKP